MRSSLIPLSFLMLFALNVRGLACDQTTLQCSVPAMLAGKSGTLLIRKGAKQEIWGVGLSNDALKISNGPDTVYLIASDSKSFVAASILKLVQTGRIQLKDTVHSFIPEYPQSHLTRGQKEVTLFHLLTHTSGLSEAYDVPSIESKLDKVPLTFSNMMDAIKDNPLKFTPGSRYEYLNTGYLILGEVVRRVTGSSYTDFLRSNFFTSVPLTSTFVGPPDDPSVMVARSYIPSASGRMDYQIVNGLTSLAASELYADTDIYTSVPDLAGWAEAVTSGEVLSADLTRQMLTPYLNEYGFGWFIFTDLHGNLAYEHAGDYDGYQSWVRRYPNDSTTIVWLSNQAMPDDQLSKFFESVSFAALELQM